MIKAIEERRDGIVKDFQENGLGADSIRPMEYIATVDALLEDRARLCRKANDLQSDIIAERVIVHRLDRERFDHRTDPNL